MVQQQACANLYLHKSKSFFTNLPQQCAKIASVEIYQLKMESYEKGKASELPHRVNLSEMYARNPPSSQTNILGNSPEITQPMRAKLRLWMLNEMHKNRHLRETYALSVTYLDQCLKAKPAILKKEFHQVGIICAHIAAKFEDSRRSKIVSSSENLDRYLNEKKILLRLNFILVRHTYFRQAEEIIGGWDQFLGNKIKLKNASLEQKSKEIGIFSCENFSFWKYFIPKVGSKDNFKLRSLYQRLDLVFSVLKSYQFTFTEIIVNLLYLQSWIAHFSLSRDTFDAQKHYLAGDYKLLFQEFLVWIGFKVKLNVTLGKYLSHFVRLELPSLPIPVYTEALEKWEKRRLLENFCTHSINMYDPVKKIISKVKLMQA